MPKIFDCFTFFNENDVLAIRLEELSPVVDKFIIVHADQTFRGNHKPDYFDYERFRPYKDQIRLLTLSMDNAFMYEEPPTPWEREIMQRNYLHTALAMDGEAHGEDTVIISDVDEIPRRSVVGPVNSVTRLRMDKFTYGINMLTNEGNAAVRMLPWWMLWKNTVEYYRRSPDGMIIENAGWEFSSLGTPEHVLHKLKNFSHSEFDTPELTLEAVRSRMEKGQDILGRDIGQEPVEIDDSWPEAIKNNREYWSKYEW